jgi:hypothetical protein
VPVDDLAGLAYPLDRGGEDARLYLESMALVVFWVLGSVETRSWSFAVWAAGAVEIELRRGGSGGTMPLV